MTNDLSRKTLRHRELIAALVVLATVFLAFFSTPAIADPFEIVRKEVERHLEPIEDIVSGRPPGLPRPPDGVLLGNGMRDAVTLDNVVVFRSRSAVSRWLVAHEITHVMQYARMGIGGFSCAYVHGHWRLEGEADRKADFIERSPFR